VGRNGIITDIYKFRSLINNYKVQINKQSKLLIRDRLLDVRYINDIRDINIK
jgi:hypothetical protein